MKKSIVVLLISAYSILTYAQKDTVFTIQEKFWYDNTRKLCNLIRQNDTMKLRQDSLFKNFIYFDYVLGDDDTARINRRRVAFDSLFVYFKNVVLKKGFDDYETLLSGTVLLSGIKFYNYLIINILCY